MLSAVSSPSFLEQPCTYSRCVVGYQSHTKTLNSPSVTQLEQGLGRFLTSTVGAEVCKPMKCRLLLSMATGQCSESERITR